MLVGAIFFRKMKKKIIMVIYYSVSFFCLIKECQSCGIVKAKYSLYLPESFEQITEK